MNDYDFMNDLFEAMMAALLAFLVLTLWRHVSAAWWKEEPLEKTHYVPLATLAGPETELAGKDLLPMGLRQKSSARSRA